MYTIETIGGGWGVRLNGVALAMFGTHAEAAAFIRGRRSCN